MGISPYDDSFDDSIKLFKHFMLKSFRVRDSGFCQGQLAYVSNGRADAMIKYDQYSWDIAAGILLVTEAGGKVTDEKGEKIILENSNKRYNIVASNGLIHNEIINDLKLNFNDLRLRIS